MTNKAQDMPKKHNVKVAEKMANAMVDISETPMPQEIWGLRVQRRSRICRKSLH